MSTQSLANRLATARSNHIQSVYINQTLEPIKRRYEYTSWPNNKLKMAGRPMRRKRIGLRRPKLKSPCAPMDEFYLIFTDTEKTRQFMDTVNPLRHRARRYDPTTSTSEQGNTTCFGNPLIQKMLPPPRKGDDS